MSRRIIDGHHHIWRRNDIPWLAGPMVPRIFGPYEGIRRDYPIAEYLADVRSTGVERSVYVQANWAKERFEDEVAWVDAIAQTTGAPHAIVGYVDFMAEDVRPQLDRIRKYPLVRGVRMQLHWHENELFRFAEAPDLVRDARFRQNFGRFADYGLTFELQVFANQMADAAALAEEFAKVTFILQHAGMLEDLSDSGRRAWREGMRKLAAQPNVVAKLSGLGTFIHRNDPEHIATVVGETMTMFGSERCLFGSNFPIEKLWTDYGSLVSSYREAVADSSPEDAANVFWNTAARVYRIE
jgi:predicted TIM-barrel fold metal-dependent hydrolase